NGRRAHGDSSGGQRRPAAPAQRRQATRNPTKQRRSNILFGLLITTACALFLTLTTSSTVALYVFVLALLALVGYVYMLSQGRQRAESATYGDWLE
ncbi:hypothetical protein, partial [Ilumatobacter sp.]|uniref:hypothetical protein n=1 Tax=Ilumatobacter sp. TaxID=1967498 RepID=UPI003C3B5F30